MTEAPKSEAPSLERLQLLEGRRLALDASMWQVPALTVAGQAFLVQILTDEDVGWLTATPVAGGGVVASVAASLSLWQQRGAERLHSTEVKAHAVAIGVGDPNRAALERRHGMPETRRLRAFWLWLVMLGVFLIADLVALIATRA